MLFQLLVMLEWADPILATGNWGPELAESANGELLLGKKGESSAAIPSEQLGDADPEYLIVAPCGFNLQRSLRAQGVLERHPWWRDLQAVTATLRLRTVISSLIVPE
jgi:iron complex transport system substrate-binding protein